MAQCDIQSLMNDAKCFMCLTPGEQQILKLQLMCNIIGGNVWYTESIPGDSNPIDSDVPPE